MRGLFLWLTALCSSAYAQTIPNAPTNLAPSVVSASQINLSWSDTSTNEDGFKIERSADGTNFTQIAQVLPNTTNYRDTRVWPGTTNHYRMRAYNSGGDSEYSTVAATGTPALCPTSVVGWGSDYFGQLSLPVGMIGVVATANGVDHSLALKGDGTVVGWGENHHGQATPPSGLTGVMAIAAGFWNSLALKYDGTVVGWGYSPSVPSGLTGVVAISDGWEHSLALKSDGSVVGWGFNDVGQTTPPTNLTGVVAIAAGGYHSLALKSDGTVVGWGANGTGPATPPADLAGVVAIAAGGHHSLALRSDGTVVGWGDNTYGQATPPAGLTSVVAIAASSQLGDHSLALKSDGTVVGWGQNADGQITPPLGLSGVVAISAGMIHSLVTTCAPSAPSALTATGVSYSQINLAWTDNSSNEDGFIVERAPDNAGVPGAWAQVATTDANVAAYSDTGLASGSRYWYRVRAYNTYAGSTYSSQANATTVCAAPDFPMITTQPAAQVVCPEGSATFSVAATGSSPTYQWRKNGVNLGGGGNISGANTTTLTISNAALGAFICDTVPGNSSAGKAFGSVIAGRTYVYEASGCVKYTPGQYSDPDGMLSTNFCDAFDVPGIVDNTSSFTCPGFTNWSLVAKVGGICIQLGKSGSFEAPASGPLILYCNDDQMGGFWDNAFSWNVCINSEGAYDVVVTTACGSQTSSSAVLTVNTTPGCMTLAVTWPTDYAYTTNSTVTVTGTASARDGLAGVTVNVVGAVSTNAFANWTANLSGLAVGTNTLTVIATDNTMPAHTLTNTCHLIYASGSFDGNGDGLADVWQIKYFGSVSSPSAAPTADPDGDELLNLQEFLAGSDPTLPAPKAPSNLAAAAVSTNQINLSWVDNSGTEDGLNIERAPDNGGSPGTWAQIATVSSNVTTYSDTELTESSRYWYRVRAHNANGDSAYSGQVSATTRLAAPSNLTATAVSANQINLSWMDNSVSEDGYRIYRATSAIDPRWTQVATTSANVTTYPDTGVSCGQTYYYRVTAYKGQTGSAYSNTADANTSPNDTDCDGMPNAWMQQYFGHPTGQAKDKSRTQDDADGDGFTNLQEFQAGTDPTNSASAFRIIEVWPEDDDMLITWTAVGGKRYILQSTTGFSGSFSNDFVDLNPAIVVLGTGETTVTVLHMGAVTGAPARFYRVRLVP